MVKNTRKKSPAKSKEAESPPAPPLIAAVGYLRKSTDGETASGKVRQEKSIPQQKRETTELANGKYEILDWYADPGKSGTRMDRPDFQRILTRARERHDFQAILCDNLDRFSRSDMDEVQEVALELKRAGVRWIVTAAQGTFDLGRSGHDIGEALKFVVAVWAAHEYSRQLSRRVALAMRNRAKEGKRAGAAPYGYAHNDSGGLKLGKLKEQRIVKWVFEQFAVKKKSINWITGQLNRDKVPSRRGGKWWVAAVSDMLRNPVYAGHFVFNRKKSGKFFFIDDNGEVVETDKRKVSKYLNTPNGVMDDHRNAYPALIPQALFDKAQKRLAGFTADKTHRPRADGFALTGLLFCGKCGAKLFGCRPADKDPKTGKSVPRGYRTYRCSMNGAKGQGQCPGRLEIHESVILPRIVEALRVEIMEITSAMTNPPDESTVRSTRQEEERAELQEDRDKFVKRIDAYQAKLPALAESSEETFKAALGQIADMRKELAEMDVRLQKAPASGDGYPFIEMENLREYWAGVEALIRSEGKKGKVNVPPTPEDILRVDPSVMREMLRELGVRVTVYWETREVPIMNGPRKGQLHKRHFVLKGHLQGGKFGEKGCDLVLSSVCGA